MKRRNDCIGCNPRGMHGRDRRESDLHRQKSRGVLRRSQHARPVPGQAYRNGREASTFCFCDDSFVPSADADHIRMLFRIASFGPNESQ